MAPRATDRYGSLAIGLHWLTLEILIAVYTCINLTELYPKGGDPREALKTWHFVLGLTILALVMVRLLDRLRGGAPAVIPSLPIWQSRLASSVHVLLYVFVAVMPILGWFLLSVGAYLHWRPRARISPAS